MLVVDSKTPYIENAFVIANNLPLLPIVNQKKNKYE